MTVFVLIKDNHNWCDNDDSEVIGVYQTLEDADKEMEKIIRKETKDGWVEEEESNMDKYCRRLYWGSSDDYYELVVYERELEIENKEINLYDYICDRMSEYYNGYKEKYIDKLDEEDIMNIMFNVLDRRELREIVQEEIEEYAESKFGEWEQE